MDQPQQYLSDIASVLEFGAKKYSMNNWRKGSPYTKVLDSAIRHYLLGLFKGEQVDPESGIDHRGHIGCNIAFLHEFVTYGLGENDLVTYEEKQLDTKYSDQPINLSYQKLLQFKDTGNVVRLLEASQALVRSYSINLIKTGSIKANFIEPVSDLS